MVDLSAGDTFEIAWDLTGLPIDRPAISLSAPGDPLVMPRVDGSYAMTEAVTLSRLVQNARRTMLVTGKWTWKTKLTTCDLSSIDEGSGWLTGSRDPEDQYGSESRNVADLDRRRA